MVDSGQSPDENQVSRTSGSRAVASGLRPQRPVRLRIAGLSASERRNVASGGMQIASSISVACDSDVRSERCAHQDPAAVDRAPARRYRPARALRVTGGGGLGLVDDAHPDWNLMAPPQLAADAPVADVVVPCVIGAGITVGVEAHAHRRRRTSPSRSVTTLLGNSGALVQCLGRVARIHAIRSSVTRDVPLVAQPWLDRRHGCGSCDRRRVLYSRTSSSRSLGFEPGNDRGAGIFTAHTDELARAWSLTSFHPY